MSELRLRSKRALALLVVLLLTVCLCGGCGGREGQDATEESSSTQVTQTAESSEIPSEESEKPQEETIDRDGTYDSKEDVALYIYTYGQLPPNYMTKKEARKLGWDGGSVERYAPGFCIGGDH